MSKFQVQVNLMTPTMIKCSELFAPDLDCEIDGVDGASGKFRHLTTF